VIFGLGGVKNVGIEAINEIVGNRERGGEYRSLLDLCQRVNLRKVTRRVLENLIKSGACDAFGVSRAALLAALDMAVAKGQKKHKEKQSSQASLLALAPMAADASMPGIGFACEEKDTQEWDEGQKLAFERESLGIYLTGHPLQPFRRDMERLGLTALEEVPELPPRAQIKTGVLVTGLRETRTKKGERMAFVQVEDLTGHGEAIFFPKSYGPAKNLLQSERPLLELTASVDGNGDDIGSDEEEETEAAAPIKLLGDFVRPLLEACAESGSPVVVDFPPWCATPADTAEFKAILEKHRGGSPVHIRFELEGASCVMALGARWQVQSGPAFYQDAESWFRSRQRETGGAAAPGE
jgi:DNA polymerase-3 subunit alpha